MPLNPLPLGVADLITESVLVINDGYRAKNEELASAGLPFARAGNIDGGFQFADADYFPEQNLGRVGNKISRPGDVVFTSKGTVGRFAYVADSTPRFVYSPQLCFWRAVDQERLDSRWLFYWMQSSEFHEQCDGVKGQTDMADYVSLRDQRAMSITLPPIDKQRTVGLLLGSLDDKIELNRRTNQTLESMARAIFRSWFVDFDPVVAKAAGRQPFGMSADLAALFPDELVSDERGEIPFGWHFRPLAEVTTKIGSGATPRGGSAVYLPEGTGFIRSQNVLDHEFEWNGLARITDEAAQQLIGVSVREGDVLLNITGDSILRTCLVDSAVLPARVSQHVAIIRPSPGIPSRYLHLRLVDDEMKDFLIGFDAGGTRQAVTKAQLETVPILVPSDALLTRFDELTEPLFHRIDSNRVESRTLAVLRDTLLPKLMSGVLRVRDAENLAGIHA